MTVIPDKEGEISNLLLLKDYSQSKQVSPSMGPGDARLIRRIPWKPCPKVSPLSTLRLEKADFACGLFHPGVRLVGTKLPGRGKEEEKRGGETLGRCHGQLLIEFSPSRRAR